MMVSSGKGSEKQPIKKEQLEFTLTKKEIIELLQLVEGVRRKLRVKLGQTV